MINKMSRVNYFPKEYYFCHDCDDKYKREDVTITWGCPSCNQSIHIYASEPIGDNKGVFIRKKASQITIGDKVRPDYMSIDECYDVLGITPFTGKKSGKLGIGLKGYTRIEVELNKWISCRIG